MSKSKDLATRFTKKIWWAPAMTKYHDQTGIAHAIHNGTALCGARPFDMGGSYEFAIQAGCRECERCRHIIRKATQETT